MLCRVAQGSVICQVIEEGSGIVPKADFGLEILVVLLRMH